jgi:hypothetical protein
MDKEFIMATAKNIEQQILWSISKWEYLSWGIKKKVATEYEGMATLALRVSGAVHKGWAFISLNEGKDCYEVRLLNVPRTKVKRTLEEVYCDNLGEVLDGLIERKAEWTDAQYNDKAVRDSARKMGMEVIDVSKKTAEPMVIDNDNKPNNKEDKTMKLNLSNNKKNETKNAAEQQVNNNEPIVRQVDVMGLMGALSRDGHAKLSDHVIEDAEAVEVKDEQAEEIESVNVGEVTLATIMPKMTAASLTPDPSPKGEGSTNAGRTKIVVAGVPKPAESKPVPKPTTNKTDETDAAPKTETCNMKPETLSTVRLVTYTTKRTGETAPRIIGFSGEDDPRWKPIHDEKQALVAAYNKAKKKDPKAKAASKREQNGTRSGSAEREQARPEVKMTSSPFGPAWLSDREGNGEKTYCMTFGVRYMDVARQLCEAYNTTDRMAWHKAEQAVRDLKAGISAGYQAEREAKRAAREAAKQEPKADVKPADVKPETSSAPAMSSDDQAMFELFKKFMAGDKAAMDIVNNAMSKAA